MKVLFNCLTMEKGGAERVITLLSNYFSSDQEVVILTLTKSKDAYELSPSVKRLYVDKTSYKLDGRLRKIFRKMSFARFFRLKKTIIREKPDIILSFLPEPSLRLMLVRKFSLKIKKIPVIISIRNDPVREYKNLIVRYAMKKLYKNVDGMVYQTSDAKKYFKDIIKTKNQIIISNPVDASVLVKPKTDERRENSIVNVGRLDAQKNHEMLIKAFSETLKDDNNDYVLKIYGEGPRREFLQSLIDDLGLKNKVFLEGQVDDVIEKINNAKVFVLSSHYEGMPNALIEAMAMGLACISTDCPCGGPKTLIRDGENGLLVKNDDEKALSLAMDKLINDKKMREKIGKNALAIRNNNSVDAIADRWLVLINKVAEYKK